MKSRVLILLVLTILIFPSVYAHNCVVYFTGIGCPHCAKTDPFLFNEILKNNTDLVIIEYEIYQQPENSGLLLAYSEKYKIGTIGIPMLIFDDRYIVGDNPIIENLQSVLESKKDSLCPLLDNLTAFEQISDLPGKPKIWAGNRVLLKMSDKPLGDYGKILFSDISKLNYTRVGAVPVQISGNKIDFDYAVSLDGWILQWRGDEVKEGVNYFIEMQSYFVAGLGVLIIVVLLFYWFRK
ncbi:MAG: hypothetical protein QXG26_02425 [Candidatus Aenigmatarchaeota archaeon]